MAESDLSTRLKLAFQAVGADINTLLAQDGTLTTLTTSQKTSLVAAINEVNAAVKAIDVKSIIDDEASDATHAWSAQKVASEILTKTNAVKDALLGGAGDAFDTLKELADLINTNKDAIAALQQIAGNHVRFDQDQVLSSEQKSQALKNIGGASAESVGTLGNLTTSAKTNLVSAVNEVKTKADKGVTDAAAASAAAATADGKATTADGKAVKAQSAVDALKTAVGDTAVDFASIYEAAKA